MDGWERDPVVRRREPVQEPGRLARHRPVDPVVVELRDGRLEFGHREPLRQPCQHSFLDFVQHRKVSELRREEALVVVVRRTHTRLCVRAHRIELDGSVGIDDTRSELDRRHMSLADGPQTHDEPDSACGDTGLVGCDHDRRVAQRRRLDRVLVREVGADETTTLHGHRHSQQGTREPRRYDVVVPVEHCVEIAVATGEQSARSGQRVGDLILRQLHDPFEDGLETR